jgi:hypothetical protein
MKSFSARYPLPLLSHSNTKKYRALFNQCEDEQLALLVEEFGAKSWDSIADRMPGRTSRQCRDRWTFYLSPSVNLTLWRPDEDELLFRNVKELGCKWTLLCAFFQDRTPINIKNRWNSVIRKIQATLLDETSESDFLHCAGLITEQKPKRDLKGNEQPSNRERKLPNPESFFRIDSLLNHENDGLLLVG